MKNNARVAAKASTRSPSEKQRPNVAKTRWARVNALVSQVSRKDWVVYVVLSLGMFALGYILRPSGDHHVAPAAAPTASVRAKAGPWGDLEVTPIAISAPDEYLSVEQVEKTPTRWIFKNRFRDDLARHFDSLEMSTEQKESLLSPPMLEVASDGVALTPSSAIVMGLSETARRGIFDLIVGTPENERAFEYIGLNSMDERFRSAGVSNATVELFKRISCKRGDYYVVSGLDSLLSALPDRDEKLRLLKGMSRQKTMLLKIHVNAQTDINSLVRYWGKGRWAASVKALLESVAALPGNNSFDLVELLPPFPSSMLYIFPPQVAQGTAAPARHDCHWTSLNFFNETADDRFTDAAFVKQTLEQDYVPVSVADRCFGDVLLMRKRNGDIIHSAVYLADDIAYTKNGDTTMHPWMFSTVSELVEQYLCTVPPDQKLDIVYYRKKSFAPSPAR